MATGMPPMGGAMPQMPPAPQGGGSPLGQLAKKPSTPDSGAPLLQMIMALLAGAGLKDVTGSLSSLMKLGQPGGMSHKKGSPLPQGEQPSKGAMPPAGGPAGQPPQPPPGIAGKPPGPVGGGGAMPPNPQILQMLLQMLMGGGQPPR